SYLVQMHPRQDKPDELAAWNANKGLISFRYGLHEIGRSLYQKALAFAAGRVKALAMANWALEELRAGTKEAPAIAAQAISEINVDEYPDLAAIKARIDPTAPATPLLM
ncbi:MAG: hypothetical protein KBG84_16575, partial [Planctomycetes bacterium]|nr:hypothetical protein [Planctomycetota bacterium]